MGTQGYRDQYRMAFHQANSDLAEIFEEYEQLQLRKEQIEDVLTALEPFIRYAGTEQEIAQPGSVIGEAKPEKLRVGPEPVLTAEPTAARPQASNDMDPIQRRINSALGLAVA